MEGNENRCKATLSSLSRNNSPLPTLLHLYNSPTPTPPIQPCAENKCTLTIGTISILIVIIPIVESEEEGGRFSCLPDARFASGATVDANPRYLRTRRDRFFLLSLSVCLRSFFSSAVKRERSWVWSRMQESALRAS